MAFFNPLALPFFCFLLSWGSSTSTPPSPPPPSSAHAAADALRNRGYSLFAFTIDSTNTNFSGTILAPPDFNFSFSTAKILSNRPSPPRPSSVLLRYHTLKTPLTWVNLLSNVDGAEIPTLYNNNCLFFFRSSIGEISVSSTKNSIGVVKIRQPDLYVDDHLAVHGIDGVLDPASAEKCSVPEVQTSVIQSQDHRSLLDHAIRALRRRRFTVAATALTIKRSELLSLTSVSVFAPSDMALFSHPDGFRYDYRHHVVSQRYGFGDLSRNAKGTMVLETLDPNKTLVVNFIDGFVTVNGVIVNSTEVYRNRWIVVLSVTMSLDDAVHLLDSSSFAPSPAPATMEIRYPGEKINGVNASFQSPGPATMNIHYPDESINGSTTSVQSPSPATTNIGYPDERINASVARVQSPSPATTNIRYPYERINGSTTSVQSPSLATMESNVNVSRCVFGIPAGMEGGDLLCPASGLRKRHLQEEDLIVEHVALYAPLDVKDQPAEGVNQSLPLISSRGTIVDYTSE
ncbi:hypothetical protein HAX54_037747 [Datura stramonium]|uniref:FAS1 domain-containing protein n=1 Tax=Datura stramonium TaxID=4076 RepID=A0ABS8VM10_DATST|nr:hypothetical protein [Datura stramonium]